MASRQKSTKTIPSPIRNNTTKLRNMGHNKKKTLQKTRKNRPTNRSTTNAKTNKPRKQNTRNNTTHKTRNPQTRNSL